MLRKDKKKQTGVTLLEVLSVIIIGILIVVGSFYLYSKVSNQKKDSQIGSYIMSLRLDINNIYGNQGTFGETGSISNTLENIGIIPEFFKDTNNNIVSPYDSEQTILFDVIGENNQYLKIGIQGVPIESCIRLSTKSIGYISVGIDDVDINATVGGVNNSPTPIVASDNCTGDNTIYYVIGVSN